MNPFSVGGVNDTLRTENHTVIVTLRKLLEDGGNLFNREGFYGFNAKAGKYLIGVMMVMTVSAAATLAAFTVLVMMLVLFVVVMTVSATAALAAFTVLMVMLVLIVIVVTVSATATFTAFAVLVVMLVLFVIVMTVSAAATLTAFAVLVMMLVFFVAVVRMVVMCLLLCLLDKRIK